MLEYVNATTSVSASCEEEVSWSGRTLGQVPCAPKSGAAALRREGRGHIVYGHGHGSTTVLRSCRAGHRQRRPLRVGGQGAPLTPGRVHPSRELLRCRIAQIVRMLIIFGQRFEAGLSPLSVV